MLLTPHTFIGVAVASTISNPLISVPLSFVLHFVMDKTPHWDFYSNTKRSERTVGWRPLAVMMDMVVGIAIGLTFTYYALWQLNSPFLALNIFLCGVASVLPDVLTAPVIYFKKSPLFFRIIHKIQSNCQWQASLPLGLLTQFIAIAISCYFIYLNLLKI
jgi:hypothetical protein